jgi:alanine dehydrogenase
MKIGLPRETKDQEHRVGMTPDGVRTLVEDGHTLLVEKGAGVGSGFADDAYVAAGASLVPAEEAWSTPDLIVKVKEPNPEETKRLRAGQTLFTYLHLAAAPELARALLETDVIGIAYETIRNEDGTFPVLAPMSEVAGRLATQIGVTLLQKNEGGKGLLVGGVPGVPRGRITVIGAGIVGINAVRVAHALGAEVDVLDVDLRRLTYVYDIFGGELNTLFSNRANIERSVLESDLVIGAVYVHGRRAPVLVSEKLVQRMTPGAVLVDVAVDQGGCIETIRPTSHTNPTYELHGVIHYGVPNMPGAVPRTSTFALTNTTLHFVEKIAALGPAEALRRDDALRQGANIWRGEIVSQGVAESLGLPWRAIEQVLGPDTQSR